MRILTAKSIASPQHGETHGGGMQMRKIKGTAGDDRLAGSYADYDAAAIASGALNELFRGGAGNDEIHGHYGDDVLHGGQGADALHGGGGSDILRGDRGNDAMVDSEGFNRMEGGTGNDWLGSIMGLGAVNVQTGGRGADTFHVLWHEDNFAPSLTWVADFRPSQGDRISMEVMVPPTPESVSDAFPFGIGTRMTTAETFDLFDTNDDGRMDDADDAVVQHGADLHFALPNGTVVLAGTDHLDWSMLI